MNNTARRSLTTTSIHIMAFDSIVNVNSLFTLAVFLGLALNPPTQNTPSSSPPPAPPPPPSPNTSWPSTSTPSAPSSSPASSPPPQTGHQDRHDDDDGGDVVVVGGGVEMAHHVNIKMLRAGILASAAGSASGCMF
ncbi:hypothetical protein LOK49_LG15G01321 [Camellia lanceoleosa]|uniref:Uncharacterized protein n=1 Tax=Camellia lanceoleosa TaxID=1840588 RepID=A0ACC0F2Y7_9ERIC|nr:hypothetical protein LOK49_LG15G01321 [Camellia lanceoleosa]